MSLVHPPIGALYHGHGRCTFTVWAPRRQSMALCLEGSPNRRIPMAPVGAGYFTVDVEDVQPGQRYEFEIDGDLRRPDPASRWQPAGVHGPSAVVDPSFAWSDGGWYGLPLREYILYELHVGTFTPAGTFGAIIPQLDALVDLGVTALELMPVAQNPGARNWGYDGVYLFAVQDSYGGPDGLRALVNACHARGLAVVLDVVYNHLGPEGNYLREFGPYFTKRYQTPWGAALNFDGPDADGVRHFFIENARCWMREYHIDAFRLDAVHAIVDLSSRPFLAEWTAAVRDAGERLNRRVYAIAETDANDTRFVASEENHGFGFDSQWNDDWHHALHTLLTDHRRGYYADYGSPHQLEKAFSNGYVFTGGYSQYRQRRHGVSANRIPGAGMVVFTTNHDQIGNPMAGERLNHFVSFAQLKLAAATMLLSPYLPMLFMGEEYGETAPFFYFVDHSDPSLIEAVRRGRRAEFESFAWPGEPPDPQSASTFQACVLNHELRKQGHHKALLDFHRCLIGLRKSLSPLAVLQKEQMKVQVLAPGESLLMRRWTETEEVFAVFHFGREPVSLMLPVPDGRWYKRLDSEDAAWAGGGSELPEAIDIAEGFACAFPAACAVLYEKQSPVQSPTQPFSSEGHISP
jgi:maltooligosyltrehalose trehalohydrolase